MNLIEFGENIWIMDGDRVKMLSIPFQTRMTIVRLPDDLLWIHSPVAITRDRMDKIDSLGKVHHLVSPNKYHHLFLGDWKKEYPKANIWASPGLAQKRKDLTFSGILQEILIPPWAKAIDQMHFLGNNILTEVIFFHKLSKTLILTDIIQNHDPELDNLFWRRIKKMTGTLAPNGGVSIDLRFTFRDKVKAKKSLEQMLDWDFEKVIISHGICIKDNAKDWIKQAFSWLK